MSVYIKSAAQISIQSPLEEEWLENPVWYEGPYHRAVEAAYKPFLDPIASRRMGKVLKRAVATSVTAVETAGVEKIDAVVTGSGLGCMENTEKFLTAMLRDGEELLQPTFFINSTHNTISSHVAVHLKCRGYNNTYVHRGVSFESALLDAFMQFETGRISTAFVGGHDEMTPDWFTVLGHAGCWKEGEVTPATLRAADTPGTMSGETAVSMVLSDEGGGAMAEVRGVEIVSHPSMERLIEAACRACGGVCPDLIMTGRNGDAADRRVYDAFCAAFAPGTPQGWWKHIFGESYTSAALGVYASAVILGRGGRMPGFMLWDGAPTEVKNILVYNHFRGEDHSFVMLSLC